MKSSKISSASTSGKAAASRSRVLAGLQWAGLWVLMVAAMVAAGALLGALLFLLIGTLAGIGESPTARLLSGLYNGGFYLLIWAPGVSFVACLMLAHRRRRKLARQSANTLDSMDKKN